MATRFTAATTRTATAAAGKHPRRNLLQIAQVIASPETQLKYRIERLLGQGGFGQAYLARRLGRSTLVPDIVCIKVSQRIDGWLREAYFGQLLDGHARAIRVFDTFPLIHHDEAVMYCLALEYAPHGDLSAFLRRHDRSWTESTTRREIAGVLEVLGKLHRGQMLHRDLTPDERLRVRQPSPQAG
jgi:serine/threonine protein kinase